MITLAVLALLAKFATGLLSAVPTVSPPEGVTGAVDFVRGWVVMGFQLGNWIPYNVVLPCAVVCLAAWGAGVVVKLARIVLSLFTAGGGSAA